MGVFLLSHIARQVGFGLALLRDVAGEIRLGFTKLRLKRAGVDGEEPLAFFDVVAFVEEDAGELAAYLGFDGDGGVRFDVADHLNFDGDVLLRNGCDHYRNGHIAAPRRGRRSLAGAAAKGQCGGGEEAFPEWIGPGKLQTMWALQDPKRLRCPSDFPGPEEVS